MTIILICKIIKEAGKAFDDDFKSAKDILNPNELILQQSENRIACFNPSLPPSKTDEAVQNMRGCCEPCGRGQV